MVAVFMFQKAFLIVKYLGSVTTSFLPLLCCAPVINKSHMCTAYQCPMVLGTCMCVVPFLSHHSVGFQMVI